MKHILFLSLLICAMATVGCNNAPTPNAEEQAQQVQKANEPAMNDPRGGAANPDATADQGP